MPVEQQGAHEVGGAPRGRARPPPSWAPRGSPDRLVSPIYTHIPRKHPRAPRNPKIGKKQQLWVGPPVNRLVPKII